MREDGNDVPVGWQLPLLSDVTETFGRIGWKGLTAKEYTESGPLFLSVHSLNYGDEVDYRDAFHISQERYDESPEIMLEPQDVLICKDGAGIGKVGIVGPVEDPVTINSSLLRIKSKPAVLPKFLYYTLVSPYFQWIVQSRLEGATTPHLYQRDIKQFPVRLPAVTEQQRIVAILDEAFDGIASAVAATEQNLVNARELFESRLNGVFSQEGAGWMSQRLADLGTPQTGTTPKTSETENYGDHIPFIKPGDFLKDGSLDYENIGLSDKGLAQSRLIASNSVLMVCIGATIGKTGYAVRDVTSNQQVNALNPRSGMPAKLLFYGMTTREFQAQVLANSSQATLPIINKTKWGNLSLSLPTKPDEQATVLYWLDRLQGETQILESVYSQKIDSLTELKQSILQKAFAGELTAEPDKALAAAGL